VSDGPGPPPIVFRAQHWPADRIAGIAGAWREALGRRFQASTDLTALVMASHPEAVALFFALSAGRAPVILLPPDPRSWRTAPPIPTATRIVLPPALAHLEAEATRIGLRAEILPEPGGERSRHAEIPFLSCPGLVFFTSGSTGLPRPVYRTTVSLIRAATALTAAMRFPPRGGVIGALPLDRSYGMNACLMAATVLGRPLGLLEHFNHRALLGLFASREYHLWAGSPMMADVLSRSAPGGPHPAPPVSICAGRLPVPLCRAFEAKFGVPLRQLYGTTETLSVTVDLGADPVRPGTAGRPLPGSAVRIGDDPRAPGPASTPGAIWVSSPWVMEGYGFPPDVASDGMAEGWWRSPDIGRLDEDGYLIISGRRDDCIRTATGHLIDPARVAAVLEGCPGVADVAVVPVEAASGPVLGVLVQAPQALSPDALRVHLIRCLPAWSQPRVLEVVPSLPRLPSGRIDRRACITMLGTAVPARP
jgi:acyl-CoA synthetase (AMP-forming)/AMP-acid ligase II